VANLALEHSVAADVGQSLVGPPKRRFHQDDLIEPKRVLQAPKKTFRFFTKSFAKKMQ